jgi:hypothetical protein
MMSPGRHTGADGSAVSTEVAVVLQAHSRSQIDPHVIAQLCIGLDLKSMASVLQEVQPKQKDARQRSNALLRHVKRRNETTLSRSRKHKPSTL